MYSREDIKEMLNELKDKIYKKTEDEINYYLNMSGKRIKKLISCLCPIILSWNWKEKFID